MLFVTLPKPEALSTADFHLVMTNFLIMKLGGQTMISEMDMSALARDYAGYMLVRDPETLAYTLTLKTRPEEFPPPELTPKVLA